MTQIIGIELQLQSYLVSFLLTQLVVVYDGIAINYLIPFNFPSADTVTYNIEPAKLFVVQ